MCAKLILGSVNLLLHGANKRLYIYRSGCKEDFFHFFVKKCFNYFFLTERVIIFALDFPTSLCERGKQKFFEHTSGNAKRGCKKAVFIEKVKKNEKK